MFVIKVRSNVIRDLLLHHLPVILIIEDNGKHHGIKKRLAESFVACSFSQTP